MKGVLIIGCGYTGLATARRLAVQGVPVWGTTRSADRAHAIRAAGAEPLLFDAGQDVLPDELRGRFDVVVDTVGPAFEREGDTTEQILGALDGFPLQRFIYLSSTSVYGDFDGAWVDEDSPCAPTAPAGVRRLAVESLLASRCAAGGLPVVILRLPAIYGPGREGLLLKIRAGRLYVVGDGSGYGNRIHVDDLADAVVSACRRAAPGTTYLVTDDEPAPRGEVADYVAGLLGLPPPPRLALEVARARLSPSVLSMYVDSKRLRNVRMKADLLPRLSLPSFREGFRSLLDAA